MTLQPHAATANDPGVPGATHDAMPAQPGAPSRETFRPPTPPVRDLRRGAGLGPRALDYPRATSWWSPGCRAAASPR